MRKSLTQINPRASAFALACLALVGADVKASAVTQTYSTSGQVGTTGITSPDGSAPANVISFTPMVTGSFTAPSALSLGSFQVATLAAGQETDYSNTPFTITYNPVQFGTENYTGTTTPITITGTLTGAITGSMSNVVATFNSISNPVFDSPDGQSVSTLSILNNPLNLVPSSAGGLTSVQAFVDTTSPSPAGTGGGGTTVPEPTTFAILATAVVGFGLRQRLRSRGTA